MVKFIKTVAAAGLYVHLRIGPYVCAEWNYGCVKGSFLHIISLSLFNVLRFHMMQRVSCVVALHPKYQVQD